MDDEIAQDQSERIARKPMIIGIDLRRVSGKEEGAAARQTERHEATALEHGAQVERRIAGAWRQETQPIRDDFR